MNQNTEWYGAATILDSAAEVIKSKGWQQGATITPLNTCAAMALEQAFLKSGLPIAQFQYAQEALSRLIGIPREVTVNPGGLDVPYWGESIMQWNDVQGRSAEEVVETFSEAARLARKLAGRQ